MRVAIAGLGLIGGSFAKAIHEKTAHKVIGYDRSPQVLRQAMEDGVIEESAEDDFSGADMVLVALYPGDAVAFIRSKFHSFRKGATVIDLCGVKRYVCDAVQPLFEDGGVTFIGGHPMAGRECSGYENAAADLYQGASMILTPFSSTPTAKVEAAGAFFRSLGFGHIEVTTPQRHDNMIAYTSQLAHVVSSAYIQSPESRDYQGFSAGSFKDLTRVAKLNDGMWTELFLCNGDYLAGQIQVIIDNLTTFRDYIESKEADKLRAVLRQNSELKEKLG